MKIPTQRLLLVAACSLLAAAVASDGVGHGTSRRSRLRYIMHHRTGCGGGLVVASPQKHEKKEPVILSYRPDRTDHFLFARDVANKNTRNFGWGKHREEYVDKLTKRKSIIRVSCRTYSREDFERLHRIDGFSHVFTATQLSDFIEELHKVDYPKDSSEEWRRIFFEAIAWRYPQDGTFWGSQSYFSDKVKWTRMALYNGSFEAEPTKVLEAAVGVLTEVAEWGFRKERLKEVSPQTGSSFPFGMPEAAARKSEEAAIRLLNMELLYENLEAARLTLAKETWEKCNLMLGEAYRRQDRVELERLRLLKKRILGSLDEAERDAMLRLIPPADRPPSEK